MIHKLLISLLTIITLNVTLLNADASTIFVTTTLGYTHENVDQKDKTGSIILANELGEDGYNFELGVGYKITQDIALSLNYQRVLQDETFSNNIYLSAEYSFVNSTDFTPYIGVNGGYSQLEYSSEPINTKNNDYISGSWLAGTTLGISYPLTKNMDFLAKYSLNITDHKTQLISKTAHSELTHNYSHSINLGVRVYF